MRIRRGFPIAVCAFLVSLPVAAARPPQPGGVQVFTAYDSATAQVNLQPLEPLSPAMRAILALYAMRANGGCPPGEEIQCPLTTALGLGRQCSEEQVALVQRWFKRGIPPLNLTEAAARKINKSRDFSGACTATPHTATQQSTWWDIRVRKDKDNLVTVWAKGSWTNGPGAGGGWFTYITTYRIQRDRVKVESHEENVVEDLEAPPEG